MSVILELPDNEAETWRILKEAGVFNILEGSAELHFSGGKLIKINRHEITFKRMQVVIPVVQSKRYAPRKTKIHTEAD